MDKEPSGPSSTGSRSARGFGLFGSAVPCKSLLFLTVAGMSATWANTLGSIALLYSAFGVIFEKARGAEDDLNTIAAGTLTGVLYKSPGRSCIICLEHCVIFKKKKKHLLSAD
uniref:Uncharacterized protein n=1 Tax=Sinocyclocheilus grahami TaxID=75366 RepID=A0A672L210_SINGR